MSNPGLASLALMLFGLCCLLYYLWSVWARKTEVSEHGDRRDSDMSAVPNGPSTTGTRKESIPADSVPRDSGLEESRQRPVQAPSAGAPVPSRNGRSGAHGDGRTRRERLKRIDAGALADTLKVQAREDARGTEEPPLMVDGVLYLSRGRHLPVLFLSEENSPRGFDDLKRVGRGTLIAEGGGFYIRCGNAGYSYSVAELEQIVFRDRGLALIPVLSNRPVPVFITENSDDLKDYIKKNAHIISNRL